MINLKKAGAIALFALILALLAIALAQNAQDTADINNIFEIVVNNTDLGTNGTNERMHDVTYYTNTSPVAVHLLFHVIGTGASFAVDTNVSINNTVVLDKDYKTDAGSGVHDHFSYYFIVPKNSNYSITNSSSIASVEWREYPILAGKNGTLSINQTISCTGGDCINQTQLNAKVNKSGEYMTGDLFAQTVGGGNVAGYVNLANLGNPFVFAAHNSSLNTISIGALNLNSSLNKGSRLALGAISTDSTVKPLLIIDGRINQVGDTNNIDSKMDMYVLHNGNALRVMSAYDNGTTEYPGLAGTGTVALCVDSTGKPIRSTNATSNYLTC